MPAYKVTVLIVVDSDSDEHLHSINGIENEVTSWLANLGADVTSVTVEQIAEVNE